MPIMYEGLYHIKPLSKDVVLVCINICLYHYAGNQLFICSYIMNIFIYNAHANVSTRIYTIDIKK